MSGGAEDAALTERRRRRAEELDRDDSPAIGKRYLDRTRLMMGDQLPDWFDAQSVIHVRYLPRDGTSFGREWLEVWFIRIDPEARADV